MKEVGKPSSNKGHHAGNAATSSTKRRHSTTAAFSNRSPGASVAADLSCGYSSPTLDEVAQLQCLSGKRLSVLAKRARTNPSNIQTTCSSSGQTSVLSEEHIPISSLYVDFGDCTQVCEYCHSRFWFEERLSSSSNAHAPKYNRCCKAGRVRISYPLEPPNSLKQLFDNSRFLDNIRVYNSMFAMTSFGATIDESINLSSGPYVFKISGQVCHRIGSFFPSPGERPRFLQMYVYDTQHELSNRLSLFGDHGSSSLDPEIVRLLVSVLDENNKLVKLLRTARELCNSTEVPEFAICLYSSVKEVCYDRPAAGVIGTIIYDNQPRASAFDIVIHMKNGVVERVSKLHSLYMSLQYPLLFPYGEQGWNPNLHFVNDDLSRITMDMFYSYQIHDRFSTYTLLLRGGRLFQQYLVDAYVSIEQNRLDYIASHQDMLRTEYLQGIHDALLRGDTSGHDIGKRTILPTSFTGGPRYMYKHYQDALAICRVYGNPQYFITFTCNVKWPEITRYLAEIPSLKAHDRPDIIVRVFKMKVNAFLKHLRSGVPFGEVVAGCLSCNYFYHY
ncbi:putative helitron helicase-like domain-containing protein [Helianthus annuus]|nr:putative helitron helicase-like domain-containing protein [Helianthus annuus]